MGPNFAILKKSAQKQGLESTKRKKVKIKKNCKCRYLTYVTSQKNLDPFLPVFSHFFMSYFDVFGSIFKKSAMTDLLKVIVSICLVSYNILYDTTYLKVDFWVKLVWGLGCIYNEWTDWLTNEQHEDLQVCFADNKTIDIQKKYMNLLNFLML